jgi:meso-butanediol dehydrogenase / (S,S)-butanediol dehydrogenase / diacetyl reductase
MGRIDGKVAIVTGAGAGIGRAIARRFASEGAMVIAADIKNAAGTENILPLDCDVTRSADVASVVETCRARFGRLDILVNCAGNFPTSRPLHEIPFEDWDRTFAVHVRGAFAILKYALPLMIKSGGGAVVNMASTGGLRAVPGIAPYTASKGALLMLTKQAALEYAQDNIRVNAICPGTINTEKFQQMPPQIAESLGARIPMARFGTPDEVASLALFLSSDEASYISGTQVIADGAMCAGSGRPPRVERILD